MYYVQFVLLIMTQTVQNLPTARGKPKNVLNASNFKFLKCF